VLSDVRESMNRVKNGGFLVRKWSYTTFNIVNIRKMWEKKGKIRRTKSMTKKRSSEIFTLKMEIFPEIGPWKFFLVPPNSAPGRPWLHTIRFWLAHPHSRNHELTISTAITKAKYWEPVFSQALNQNKIDRQRVKIQSQAGTQIDGCGGWNWLEFRIELARKVGEEIRNQDLWQ